MSTHIRPSRQQSPARRLERLEQRVVRTLRPLTVLPLLRISLGIIFIWFGALKIGHVTPVGQLVAATLPWLDANWFIPALGVIEVSLGAVLLLGRWLALTATATALHLSATFLVLLVQPRTAFQNGNPLLPTTIGEFVIKNVVLISAALVLATSATAEQQPKTNTP
jgi:putative oxidoreductase